MPSGRMRERNGGSSPSEQRSPATLVKVRACRGALHDVTMPALHFLTGRNVISGQIYNLGPKIKVVVAEAQQKLTLRKKPALQACCARGASFILSFFGYVTLH